MTYPFKKIEQTWQKYWRDQQTFACTSSAITSHKQKAYVLEMFPYPSGHLHMGHVRNYTIGDVVARYMRAKGHAVLHPMGWDAFGLPAENAALDHAKSAHDGSAPSPKTWTYANIEVMRSQLQALGLAVDWNREFASCDVQYYGLEQGIFLDLLARGIAYQSENWVNWDPVEHTVLANEQVVNGCGWRSGAVIEKKRLRQWSLRITDYAEELLQGLEQLPKWPDKIKKMQENWIGKSKGARVRFQLSDPRYAHVDVFTTRHDTLYGASFIAIAPTHPIATDLAKQDHALDAFIKECQQTSTSEADMATAEKQGYDTGITAIVPITGKSIPVHVANFVLMDYGTGAVFGCPAHDARDFDFATKYNLSINPVIHMPEGESLPYLGDGCIINSHDLDGMRVDEAKAAMLSRLKAENVGEEVTTYRLRDWGISRQRYWGCPIPIIYCDDCGAVPVLKDDLPVTLPDDPDFSIPGNPLDRHPTWKHTSCPTCHKPAVRETDTFDTFFESSWYFLRFINPTHPTPVDRDLSDHFMPVDVYVGGPEHAVMHLLYARFFVKALRDMGYIHQDEPFTELLTQGMVCHPTYKNQAGEWVFPKDVFRASDGSCTLKDGTPVYIGRSEKMSKSKKNSVDPLHIIDMYGADTARLFVLSDTPYDKDFDWNEDSLDGAWRYLSKIYRVYEKVESVLKSSPIPVDEEHDALFQKVTHRFIKHITDIFDKHGFNKALAIHREFCRALDEALAKSLSIGTLCQGMRVLLQTLSPIAPHLMAELWLRLGSYDEHARTTPLDDALWPTYDADLVTQDLVTIAVQVNGKTRGSIQVDPGADDATIEHAARSLPTVQRDIDQKTVHRVIIVKGRIINIVAKG